MIEIEIDNVKFKIKDYLDYADLGKINFLEVQMATMKAMKWSSLVEGKTEQELNDLLAEADPSMIDDLTAANYANSRMLKTIDDLLIHSPSMMTMRPSLLKKLFADERYIKVKEGVLQDIADMVNLHGPETGKKL